MSLPIVIGIITPGNNTVFLKGRIGKFLGSQAGELFISNQKLLGTFQLYNYEYDPGLVAGLIIQIGSVMVDTSIKTKLKKLEKNMLEV